MFLAHAGIMVALSATGLLMVGAMLYLDSLAKYPMAQALTKAGALRPLAAIALLAFVGSGLAARFAASGRLHRSLAALVATFAAAFLLAWVTVIGPLDRATTAAEFGRQVRREAPPDAPLFSFTDVNNTVIFYAARPIAILPTPDRVRQELARGRPFYLICYETHLEALGDTAGLTPVVHLTNPLRPSEGFRLFRGGPAAAPGP